MVLQWSDATQADALALAGELRAAGADGGAGPRVVLYPEVDKPGKQFKYAESIGVRIAALVGDDEAAAGTVTLKDLKNRAQITVPRADGAGRDSAAPGRVQVDYSTQCSHSETFVVPTPAAPCGPPHVGQQAVLLGWVHRVRDMGAILFVDVRDRYGVTQVVVRDDEALVARGQEAPHRDGGRRRRHGRPPQRGHGQPEAGHRRGRGRGDRGAAAERRQAAAVLDRRRRAGHRGSAPALSLSRSAPAAACRST